MLSPYNVYPNYPIQGFPAESNYNSLLMPFPPSMPAEAPPMKASKSTSDFAFQGGKIGALIFSVLGIPTGIALHRYFKNDSKRLNIPLSHNRNLRWILVAGSIALMPLNGFIDGFAAGGIYGFFKNRNKGAQDS
jgi:hypothetical protein